MLIEIWHSRQSLTIVTMLHPLLRHNHRYTFTSDSFESDLTTIHDLPRQTEQWPVFR